MTGAWQPTRLDGVLRRDLEPIADVRGSFMELWRESLTADLGATFRQANLSRSAAGVLRGMHFHERQADLWIVVEGRAAVAAVDLRSMVGGTSKAPAVEEFEMRVGSALFLPKGVAHGFLALEPLALLYLVTEEYDGSDEHGFAWDDPTAALTWPLSDPILSGRDAANPSLAEAVAAARQRGVLASAS